MADAHPFVVQKPFLLRVPGALWVRAVGSGTRVVEEAPFSGLKL
jgi:hypothetical protein